MAQPPPQTESPVYTTLGLCLSKGDRFDWAIQKATELGVGAIAPLQSERVDFSIPRTVWKSASLTGSRLPSVPANSAGGQVPSITPPQSLAVWVENVSAEQKWVLHCADNTDASASAMTQGTPGMRRFSSVPRAD